MEGVPDAGDGRRALGRLLSFVAVGTVLLVLACCTPLRRFLDVESIRAFAIRIGPWGPLAIVVAGVLSPLLFLPRWPVAFAGGLLYGIAWGSILATAASTLGACLHFALARSLLAPAAQRALRRFRLLRGPMPPRAMFVALLFLRAFPLSNFVATNLVAGALRISWRVYVATALIGMLPSSVMYAAWGKLVKRPAGGYYGVAAGSVLFIALGCLAAQRYFGPWLKAQRERGGGGQAGN